MRRHQKFLKIHLHFSTVFFNLIFAIINRNKIVRSRSALDKRKNNRQQSSFTKEFIRELTKRFPSTPREALCIRRGNWLITSVSILTTLRALFTRYKVLCFHISVHQNTSYTMYCTYWTLATFPSNIEYSQTNHCIV